MQEHYPQVVERKAVSLDFTRMERFIGKAIGADTIRKILEYMDFEIVSSTETTADVLVPSYRVDVYRECDVVEEVLRIYGYNNIELPEGMRISVNATPNPDPEQVRTKVCDLLAANGFMECMSNSLTKADYYNGLKTYPSERLVPIVNPLSSDLNVMRQTLLFSALEDVAYNLNRQASDLMFFEMGNVYTFEPAEGETLADLKAYREEMRLMITLTGKGTQYWRNTSGVGHYFALKGYVEMLMKRLGVDLYSFESNAAPADLFQDGLTYSRGGKTLLMMGAVAPARLKAFGIKQPVFVAEISWKMLFDLYKKNKVRYSELPKFPRVRRDLALLLDEDVTFAQLRKTAFATEKRYLKQVTLFDVYRGDKIPAGKKQYALSFVFLDEEKTLTDQAIEQMTNKLLGAFTKFHNAALR